jgi:hypothetical protein
VSNPKALIDISFLNFSLLFLSQSPSTSYHHDVNMPAATSQPPVKLSLPLVSQYPMPCSSRRVIRMFFPSFLRLALATLMRGNLFGEHRTQINPDSFNSNFSKRSIISYAPKMFW